MSSGLVQGSCPPTRPPGSCSTAVSDQLEFRLGTLLIGIEGLPSAAVHRRRRNTTPLIGSTACLLDLARCRSPASGRSACGYWGRPRVRRNDTGDRGRLVQVRQDRDPPAIRELLFFAAERSLGGEVVVCLCVVMKRQADLLEVVHALGPAGGPRAPSSPREPATSPSPLFPSSTSPASARRFQTFRSWLAIEESRRPPRPLFIASSRGRPEAFMH